MGFCRLVDPVSDIQGHRDVDGNGLLFEEVKVHIHQHYGSTFRVFGGQHALQRGRFGQAVHLFPFIEALNSLLNILQGFVERFTSSEHSGKVRNGHAVIGAFILMHNNGITHIFSSGGIAPHPVKVT